MNFWSPMTKFSLAFHFLHSLDWDGRCHQTSPASDTCCSTVPLIFGMGRKNCFGISAPNSPVSQAFSFAPRADLSLKEGKWFILNRHLLIRFKFQAVSSACALAKHRKANNIEVEDVKVISLEFLIWSSAQVSWCCPSTRERCLGAGVC